MTTPQKISYPALSDAEQRYVAIATEMGYLPELCRLKDYDPDIGAIPEHWVPQHMFMTFLNKWQAALPVSEAEPFIEGQRYQRMAGGVWAKLEEGSVTAVPSGVPSPAEAGRIDGSPAAFIHVDGSFTYVAWKDVAACLAWEQSGEDGLDVYAEPKDQRQDVRAVATIFAVRGGVHVQWRETAPNECYLPVFLF
ncbi:MAG: hypothetical protein Q7S87_10355 [Agitococcus sp.]|nr:hypothetical protein [Agitococcus sp.]MDO9179471.1 hypothetical protein [Agitococcus sp.]